jgi:hypothetical protein
VAIHTNQPTNHPSLSSRKSKRLPHSFKNTTKHITTNIWYEIHVKQRKKKRKNKGRKNKGRKKRKNKRRKKKKQRKKNFSCLS